MDAMKKKITPEGIVLICLSIVLVAGISVGVIRHARRGKVELKALEPEPLLVNINTAGVENLTRLPGIGPSLAERITAYREEHGAFTTTEELLGVSGIGPSTLAEIKPFLEVR